MWSMPWPRSQTAETSGEGLVFQKHKLFTAVLATMIWLAVALPSSAVARGDLVFQKHKLPSARLR